MGLESGDILQLSKSSALQGAKPESSLPGEFLRAAVYAGIEAPVRALAQVAGNSADEAVQNGFKFIGVLAPEKSEFGSGKWYAQQLGSAVGMAVPFLSLRTGIEKAAGRLAPATFGAATDSLLKASLRESAITGTSGFVYGAVLNPSKDGNLSGFALVEDRFKNGAADAATFAALGFGMPYLSRGLNHLASVAEASALPRALSTGTATILRSPLLAGMSSGLPAGIVAAEGNALKENRHASLEEFKESITGMTFVGGVFAGAGRFIESRLASESAGKATATEPAIQDALDFAKQHKTGMDTNAVAGKLGAQKGELVLESKQNALANSETSAKSGTLQQELHSFPPEISTALIEANKRLQAQILEEATRAESVFARLERLKPQEAATKHDPVASDSLAKSISDKVKPGQANELPGLDIVLGASGIEAPAHAGFLRAIEEANVPVAKITGVSGGSLVATLYANKYSAAQIKDILLSDQFRYPRADILAKCLHLTDPWNLFPYSIDFRPWLQDFVDTYKLKPQENLKIVAADKKTHAAVVFEGTNYDLVEALAASTAATNGLSIKPVNYKGRELIDGFYYHPTPADLAKAPSIVSKIGFVHKPPSERLPPWDYFMHLREMSYYEDFKRRFPDPPGHLIAETGLPDVATTTFGVSKETLMKLVEHGYKSTSTRLKQADALKAIKDAQIERNLR